MPKIALIGRSIHLDCELFAGVKESLFTNEFGKATLFIKNDVVFLARHGVPKSVPPHKINHLVHMKALKDAGVRYIIGANSVGALDLKIPPGSLIVPDDYISLWDSVTFYDDCAVHITPRLDEEMRRLIIQSADKLAIPLVESGVYIQTRGPRLETRAEVRYLKTFADVVGMTMGSEATAAQELELRYACIASMDNYAHGLTGDALKEKDIGVNTRKSAGKIRDIFSELVKAIRLSCPEEDTT